jgi:hypothetical protein
MVRLRNCAGIGQAILTRGRENGSLMCQAQVDQVAAAKGVVDGIQSEIMALQAELQHATPQEKSGIFHEINDLSAQLPAALAALDDARKALQSCRNRWGIGDNRVTGVVEATG